MSNRPAKPVYFSNGEVLETPPISVRISRFAESIYFFFGLYFVSLLSLDSYKAAEESSFNINRSSNSYTTRPRWGGSSSYGGGGGGGGGGPGSGPRRVGRVDDVRAPECGSCR